MFALSLPIGLAVATMSVDECSSYVERRETQSITDLASIYASANLAKADTAVLQVFTANRKNNIVLVSGSDAPAMTVGYSESTYRKSYAAELIGLIFHEFCRRRNAA